MREGFGSLALDINEGVDLSAKPIVDVVLGWIASGSVAAET